MPAQVVFTSRQAAGAGTAEHHPSAGAPADSPYGDGNLALHVGDDPEQVRRNRAALATGLGLSAHRLRFMDQVHGTAVAVLAEPDGPSARTPVADVLLTTVPELALAVLVADCVPVLLADEQAGVIGAVHAGRRGLEQGVVQAALLGMRSLGAQRITATVGPHIGPCCYEVGPDVQDQVVARVPDTLARTSRGTPALDLGAGVASVLRAGDVSSITTVGSCTAHDPQLYSYRRDGVTGRMAGVIVLRA